MEEIKLNELKINERDNEIFQLETLLKSKFLEKTHNEFELKNISNRLEKYCLENEELSEKIKNFQDKTEY